MQFVQAALLIADVAASLWLWREEGLISALVFFIFGLVIMGVFVFALQLGAAAARFIDRFLDQNK